MNCNCNNIYPNEDLNRWSVCQSIDILENYYTKGEVDAKIADIQVDVDLSNYYTKGETNTLLDNKLDASAYTPTDLSGYATQSWVNNKNYAYAFEIAQLDNEKQDKPLYYSETKTWPYYAQLKVIDTLFQVDADEGVTSRSYYGNEIKVNNDGIFLTTVPEYAVATLNGLPILTEHQPLKTINGQSLVGEGNITISGGGSADLSNYYNKTEVDDKLNLKANASDLSALNTTVGQLSTTVENKANKSEIPSLSGYATEQWVENKNYLKTHQPLKTINNQSLIGEGNITISGETPDLTNYYTKTEVNNLLTNKPDASNVYTKTEVNNLVNNKFWCGTQSQYDALTNKENDVLYLIYEV